MKYYLLLFNEIVDEQLMIIFDILAHNQALKFILALGF